VKKVVLILLVVFLSFLLGVFVVSVEAVDCAGNQECQSIQDEIDNIAKEISIRSKANEKNAAQMRQMQNQVASLQNQIKAAEDELFGLEEELLVREDKGREQFGVLSVKTREFYKSLRGRSVFVSLFDELSSEKNKGLAYQSTSRDQDRQIILKISSEMVSIGAEKKALEERKKYLADLSAQLNKQAEFLKGEVAGVSSYLSSLEGKIAALSAKQQSILAEKSGTFQTTVGDVPLADDPNSRPDYNPGFSPAFAAFSFGAPHFKGMSQYGAFGRAKAGQSYEDILRAYYGSGIEIRSVDANTQIVVEGYQAYLIDEYAKRIYEMPSSWGDNGGMEALKAQAVAARSYALARGGSICATESCQVFKPSPKGGNWEVAVNATAGKVVYVNGLPFSTWYASTSGGYQESYSANGYSTPGFWDTPSGRSGWTGEAYEKMAGSPWFYKGWYKSRSGDACGKSHPWLNSEEMADVLNAWKVLFEGGGDSGRVTPIGSCWGGNPYSMDELRGIGGFTSVSGASVTYSDNGVTANVTFQTNKGSVPINGKDFYKAFNLRAPGRIALKSGLFNIEVK
jgi:hypothetical protein